MSTVERELDYPAYAHPLVSWGAVFIGAVAAVAVGLLLNFLAAAFDAAALLQSLDPQGRPGDVSVFAGVLSVLANLVALYLGGFIAARAANHPDHHDGMVHGLGVWALAVLCAFAFLTLSSGRGAGAPNASPPVVVVGPLGGMGAGIGGGGAGGGVNAGALAAPGAAQAGSDGGTPGATSGAPAVTPEVQRRAEADAEAEVLAEAQGVARASETAAWFAFAALLVGLAAALLGGVQGSRHPEHFAVRPRRRVHIDPLGRRVPDEDAGPPRL